MYKAVYAYPSDLAARGPEPALDPLRDAGAATVVVALGHHGATPLMRSSGVRSGDAQVSSGGTVSFRARRERYGRIQPRVDASVAAFDPLAELTARAPEIERVAWLSGLHGRALGERYPDFLAQNALGERQPASLCPAHPEVRAFVVNLCTDLVERYDLAGLVLAAPGWLPFERGGDGTLEPWARALFGLCFADATRHAAHAADIDADRLQARVRELLELILRGDLVRPEGTADAAWLADLVGAPEWGAFLHWRCRTVADLVAEVRAALPPVVELAIMPAEVSGAGAWSAGIDLALLARVADALEIPVFEPSTARAFLRIWDVRSRIGEAPLRLVLHADPGPDGPDCAELAMELSPLGVQGIALHELASVSETPPERLRAAFAGLG